MNTKEYEPSFQMVASSIYDVSIHNDFIDLDDNQELDREFGLESTLNDIETHEDYKSAAMNLQVKAKVCEKKSDTPKIFSANITLHGVFIDDVSTSDNAFKEKLEINGSAALYSIARGFLTNISAQTLVSGKVVLPLVNFMEMKEKA